MSVIWNDGFLEAVKTQLNRYYKNDNAFKSDRPQKVLLGYNVNSKDIALKKIYIETNTESLNEIAHVPVLSCYLENWDKTRELSQCMGCKTDNDTTKLYYHLKFKPGIELHQLSNKDMPKSYQSQGISLEGSTIKKYFYYYDRADIENICKLFNIQDQGAGHIEYYETDKDCKINVIGNASYDYKSASRSLIEHYFRVRYCLEPVFYGLQKNGNFSIYYSLTKRPDVIEALCEM